MEILERLTKFRERHQDQPGIYSGDLIEEARAERDEDFDHVWENWA